MNFEDTENDLIIDLAYQKRITILLIRVTGFESQCLMDRRKKSAGYELSGSGQV
jgi:hypothetical protein